MGEVGLSWELEAKAGKSVRSNPLKEPADSPVHRDLAGERRGVWKGVVGGRGGGVGAWAFHRDKSSSEFMGTLSPSSARM